MKRAHAYIACIVRDGMWVGICRCKWETIEHHTKKSAMGALIDHIQRERVPA